MTEETRSTVEIDGEEIDQVEANASVILKRIGATFDVLIGEDWSLQADNDSLLLQKDDEVVFESWEDLRSNDEPVVIGEWSFVEEGDELQLKKGDNVIESWE